MVFIRNSVFIVDAPRPMPKKRVPIKVLVCQDFHKDSHLISLISALIRFNTLTYLFSVRIDNRHMPFPFSGLAMASINRLAFFEAWQSVSRFFKRLLIFHRYHYHCVFAFTVIAISAWLSQTGPMVFARLPRTAVSLMLFIKLLSCTCTYNAQLLWACIIRLSTMGNKPPSFYIDC